MWLARVPRREHGDQPALSTTYGKLAIGRRRTVRDKGGQREGVGYTHSLSPSRPPNNTLNTQSRAQQTHTVAGRGPRASSPAQRGSPQRHAPRRPSRAPLVGRPPPTGRAPRPPPARPSPCCCLWVPTFIKGVDPLTFMRHCRGPREPPFLRCPLGEERARSVRKG
eukprot:scaffold39147_cov58-Phaeocystis_antarctica.AAC.2